MAIPQTVANGMMSGVIGGLSHWGPKRVRTCVLASTEAENNVFGRAFTIADGGVESVQAGGEGHFAGIMIHPKAHMIQEDNQPNGYVGEFLDMGEVYSHVVGAEGAAIGAQVYYVVATGQLTVDDNEGANPEVPNCKIERHAPSTATPSLAVIRLTN